MNKSLFFTICTFSLGAFIIVWLYVIAGLTSPEPQHNIPHENPSSQNTTTQNQHQQVVTPNISHYLIKNAKGKINIYSVYSNGLTKLEKILDVNPETLRKIDKISFDEGIIIKDPEELAHIIEDYVS